MAHHRSTFAEIDLDAFRQNLKNVRAMVGPAIKTMAVVKADAYGHGAAPCSRAALEAGADVLGVGILEEGIELRESGIRAPIVVLGGIFPHEADDLIKHDLTTLLRHRRLAETLSRKAHAAGKQVGVHLKVETGMGRLGVSLDEFPGLVEFVMGEKNLILEGVFTHLASADHDNAHYTREQLKQFDRAVEFLRSRSTPRPLLHTANSAALLRHPQSWHDMVRPGIILYGSLPDSSMQSDVDHWVGDKGIPKFKPVMNWKTRIIQVNSVPKGSALSYGGQFVTSRDSRIAVLPIGYADGLHRLLSNRIDVLVRGQRVPQVGTICMDMTLVDVTGIPGIQEEEEVVLLGTQAGNVVTADEMAEKIGTISYEILCSVGRRVPRVYR